MPLNLIFVTPGNYRIDDNGIPGDNTSVIRDGTGAVIFTFVHPADSLGFTTSSPGVNLAVNLTDTLGAANFTLGNLTSAAASPDTISIANVRTTGIGTLVANGALTELGSDAGADIVAGQVILSAVTGVGTASNAIETQTSIIEAKTDTGDINIRNFGPVQIGGATDSVDGLDVATSGNINFSTVGTILLSDDTGTESVHGGATSGNVTMTAIGIGSDIIANVDNDAITVSGGNLVLEAGRDIALGSVGANFDNDVRARGGITINVGRDFSIDGFSDLASDDFGGATVGNISITAGRNIEVRSVTGTDGSIFANGTAGADVILTTGAEGALIVDPASIGAAQPIASNSGDVIVNADHILINSASGISATAGEITLNPATAGREINLGSAGDAAFALELSDAELDRIFTPTLTIGNNVAGQLTVSAAISPANVQNLALRSGTDIAIQAGITTSGSLDLRAGDNLFLTASPAITVGGALTIAVDAVSGDGNTGGVAYFGNASVSAASIAISGAGDNDMLGGFESVDQIVHGNGGNDTLTSSGEGHYFGDAGNDVILAGLSSGLVPEALDGGSGIDTIDTRSFNGDYIINLATGATNFDYESFVNFENVITGGGNDQITGNASANTMQGMAGDDKYYVDNAADKVIESIGGGNDRVLASVSYALAAGAEIEILSTTNNAGVTAVNLTGNEFVQNIIGNAGNNVIDGKGGADIVQGLGGNDTIYVDNAADKVVESIGGGNDRVMASVSYALAASAEIEILSTTNNAGVTAINLTGNEFVQNIVGNAGNNVIDGKGGADIVQGLGGNDTIYVDNAADKVIESVGGGNDRVMASVSYALAAGAEIEILSTTNNAGVTAINLTGNEFVQNIIGNAGNNVIDGKGGADIVQGLGGNDTIYVDNAADKVIETAGGGNDRVMASVSYALAAGAEIEILSTTNNAGVTAVNLTGNEFVQNIIGNAGNNVIDGKGGADIIQGLGGNDTFAFSTALGPSNVDIIADFSVANDTFQLAHSIFTGIGANQVLSAAAFVIGTAAINSSQHVIYNSGTGYLYFDDDGNGAHAAQQFARVSAGLAMTNADFFVA